ncbi:MAG: peptidylprolyl isomerase [Dysgonomonas sp.]|nr:peptidylprolyl isomerase [Dysgonomonas sp.]
MSILRFNLSLLLTIIGISCYGQASDPVLLKINETPIYKSDFEYAYQKDSKNGIASKQSKEEFLSSYINYKVKVEEAKSLGLDKQRSFINEYSDYLEQLEQPYLRDSITPELLAKEIYERFKINTDISRIFISYPSKSYLPKDTIDIYQKALKVKELTKTEKFEDLVTKYSDDTISRKYRIPGYLNWKTSLSFPYVLEKEIFNTPVNSVTSPVRTNTGYEIIKVHNRRTDPGQINIAHILLAYPQPSSTKQQRDSVSHLAKEIYQRLVNGESFEELCFQYSVDGSTAERGGNLGWFGVQRPLTPAFDQLLFGIKEIDDITEPVEAEYGYHIFKLLGRVSFSDWETMKPKILSSISENDRNDILVERQINILKNKYNYRLVQETYNQLEQAAHKYNLTDSSYFNSVAPIKEDILLYVQDKPYKVKDFTFFVEKNPKINYTLSTDILYYKTQDFILDRLIEAKRQDLFNEHPNVRLLANEFYDGILYFEIMNREVWEKAQTDYKSLQQLFSDNRAQYKWESPKYKGYVVHATNKDILKKAEKLIKENKNAKDIEDILRKNLNTDSKINITIDKGLWAKGENAFVDKTIFKLKTDKEIIGYPEYTIHGKMISEPEELDDVSGLVVNDYQSILEKQWTDSLLKKYKIEINKDVLESIKD